jgi:hypothetical protein
VTSMGIGPVFVKRLLRNCLYNFLHLDLWWTLLTAAWIERYVSMFTYFLRGRMGDLMAPRSDKSREIWSLMKVKAHLELT